MKWPTAAVVYYRDWYGSMYRMRTQERGKEPMSKVKGVIMRCCELEGTEIGLLSSEATIRLRPLRLEFALVGHKGVLADGAVVGTGVSLGTEAR
jgi:hypothetical protein